MYRLLHLADVHLDAPLGGFGRDADGRRTALLDAFRSVSDVAVEAGADVVLITGDLFDGPRPEEQTVIAVRETVRRLVDADIPVFAVSGNHDARALNPGLYADALEGAVVFLDPGFGPPVHVERDAGNLFVYGFAYDLAEEPDPLATFRRSTEEGLHIVLLHGSVPGAPHWESGSSLALPLEALGSLDVDYIALGDLHRFRASEELDGLPACYPGSFAAVDLTETGLHGAVVVKIAPGGTPGIERLSSGVREVAPRVAVDVSECTTDLEVAEEITRLVPAEAYPTVVLRGEPAYPLDPEAVRAILEERCGAIALIDESRFYEIARLEDLAGQNTIAGHVVRIGLDAIGRAGAEGDDTERAALEQGLRIALRVMEV